MIPDAWSAAAGEEEHMSIAEQLGYPSFEESGYHRESLLAELGEPVSLPSRALALAVVYAEEIEPGIIALLERVRSEELDAASSRLLFRGLHILGGRRMPAGFGALMAFLRAPPDRVERLLGDAITESLARIIAGMFDGEIEPLLGLIADRKVDQFVRNAALRAFAFLTFDRKIDKAVAAEFLARFDAQKMAPPDEVTWYAWAADIALLGLDHLSPHVHAAFEDGRIPAYVAEERHYQEILAAALEQPDDATRFDDENLGYIADIQVALEGYPYDLDDTTDEPASGWEPPWEDRVPARNPWRDVGRNDPCPCGSGKKFKKCCLALL
jgi:uncharacterized protein DUF1186/SEC-C motif-containing protein